MTRSNQMKFRLLLLPFHFRIPLLVEVFIIKCKVNCFYCLPGGSYKIGRLREVCIKLWMNIVGQQRGSNQQADAPRTRQLDNGEVKLEGKLDSWLDAPNTRTLFRDE